MVCSYMQIRPLSNKFSLQESCWNIQKAIYPVDIPQN